MGEKKLLLFLLRTSSWWLLLVSCSLVLSVLASLSSHWLYSILLISVLLCYLSLRVSSLLEERTVPLDIPSQWMATVLDISGILSGVSLDQSPPSTDKKSIEEEYFEKCLPVAWIVETVGRSAR